MPESRPTTRWIPLVAVLAIVAIAAWIGAPQRLVEVARGVARERGVADLPAAAAWSFLRMACAYAASLVFAWATGYPAATHPRARRVLLPLLDIGQSVPVLGFFPAAIALCIGLLGGGRFALECASIFLIFTSQVWNLAFGVYEGLSTIPAETRAATQSLGVRGLLLWRTLLLPACVPTLLYNSILSWSNGWYFLIACEIIVSGRTQVDLPGLGSLLSGALARGEVPLALAALGTLIAIVVTLELVVWRPLRAWSSRYRYDAAPGEGEDSPWLRIGDLGLPLVVRPLRRLLRSTWARLPLAPVNRTLGGIARATGSLWRAGRVLVVLGSMAVAAFALWSLVQTLLPPWPAEAAQVPLALLLSFLRINAAYLLALLWIVPVTLWAFDHPRGARVLSLVAQIGASIPATAFFPVLVAALIGRGVGGMEVVSIALALTGMQWYLLFNMLAGVQRVPLDLKESLRALGLGRREIHRKLVLPACMPSLITGSVVAWGGTWNALILSEYVVYRDRTYSVLGVGALLNRATFDRGGDPKLLLLSVIALVVTVVTFNRLVWRRAFEHAHARYRLEG